MTRLQKIYIGAALLLVLGIYFGFDTTPSEQKQINESRANNFELIDINKLIQEGKQKMSDGDQQYLNSLQALYNGATDDSTRVSILKQLAGDWYRKGDKTVSGYFAEKIADIENTAEAWSIAGTTFVAGMNATDVEQKVGEYAFNKAIQAFENAISLEPANISHRTNLAILYAEHPLETNPMKGIQLLLELNRQHPENTSVLYQLARLGMQTGQYEKALARLEKAMEVNPNEKRIVCLASEAYKALNNNEKYVQLNALCNKLN